MLLDDIVALLADENASLSAALLKTKIVLFGLREQELSGWVNHELNGYSDEDNLPTYRIIGARPMGNMSNGAWRVSQQLLPIAHLSEDNQRKLTESRVIQSVSVLEDMLRQAEGGQVRRGLLPEAYALLNAGLGNGYKVENAWIESSTHDLRGVLAQVRSRLLDFMLELRGNATSVEDNGKVTTGDFDVLGAFQHSIFGANTTFGDNVTVVVGHNANVRQKITVNPAVYAQEALKVAAALEAMLPTSDLPTDQREATEAALIELKEAATLPTPEPSRVRKAVDAVGRIMEHAAGHMIAVAGLAMIHGLPGSLG